MRALYGDEGRDTLRAVNNLAGTVAAAGDAVAARAMLDETHRHARPDLRRG